MRHKQKGRSGVTQNGQFYGERTSEVFHPMIHSPPPPAYLKAVRLDAADNGSPLSTVECCGIAKNVPQACKAYGAAPDIRANAKIPVIKPTRKGKPVMAQVTQQFVGWPESTGATHSANRRPQ